MIKTELTIPRRPAQCTLGLKRWCLLPPDTDLAALGLVHWTQGKFQKPGAFFLTEYLVLQAAAAAGTVRMVECLQRPGDTVLIPVRTPPYAAFLSPRVS